MQPYNNRWRLARLGFLRKHPLCVMCKSQGLVTIASVVDHIIPHRMKQAKSPDELSKARALFWDSKNWQGLCDTHHNSTKQTIEKTGQSIGCDVDGMPIGHKLYWNR